MYICICKDELISDVLLWTPSYRRTRVERSGKANLRQLCTVTGCRLEDQQEAMDGKDEWREGFKEIRAYGT